MCTFTLTLEDILKSLKELSDNGMQHSDAFHQAHNEYVRSLVDEESPNDLRDALDYLKSIKSIGTLNTANMIEALEEKLGK